MRYRGGKGGAGVFQAIINQFPPHRVYIEPFVGGGNVFERKAPAASSVLADLDLAVVDRWRKDCIGRPGVEVLHGDALQLLESRQWQGGELVYLDPPYVHSTRKDVDLYRHEMTDAQHLRLLDLAASIPAMVAISGYRSAMYDDWAQAHGWRRIDFNAMTRRGVAVESLWMNYPAPAVLADYSYAGASFRERERIKRKAARWIKRWEQLPAVERGAIVSAMLASGLDLAMPPGDAGSGDAAPSVVGSGAAAAPVGLAVGDRLC